MKKLALIAIVLLATTVAIQAQTSPDPFGVVEEEIAKIETLSSSFTLQQPEIIVLDQLEMRFVPDVIKESTVLRPTQALAAFDWNNPYEPDVIILDTGPPNNSYRQQNAAIPTLPVLPTLASSSGGPSARR